MRQKVKLLLLQHYTGDSNNNGQVHSASLTDGSLPCRTRRGFFDAATISTKINADINKYRAEYPAAGWNVHRIFTPRRLVRFKIDEGAFEKGTTANWNSEWIVHPMMLFCHQLGKVVTLSKRSIGLEHNKSGWDQSQRATMLQYCWPMYTQRCTARRWWRCMPLSVCDK